MVVEQPDMRGKRKVLCSTSHTAITVRALLSQLKRDQRKTVFEELFPSNPYRGMSKDSSVTRQIIQKYHSKLRALDVDSLALEMRMWLHSLEMPLPTASLIPNGSIYLGMDMATGDRSDRTVICKARKGLSDNFVIIDEFHMPEPNEEYRQQCLDLYSQNMKINNSFVSLNHKWRRPK